MRGRCVKLKGTIIGIWEFIPGEVEKEHIIRVCFIRGGKILPFPVQDTYSVLPGTIMYAEYVYRRKVMASLYNPAWRDRSVSLFVGKPKFLLRHGVAMSKEKW